MSKTKTLANTFYDTHMKSFFDGGIVIQRNNSVAWVAPLFGWCHISKPELALWWHCRALAACTA
jgi:hypothetical protein